ASVLCTHGNEADGWNVVDYERLLEIARAQNVQTRSPNWVPNMGTRLVIDVMNDVKKTYRWVDLLKPETRGVVPLLVALEPDKAARIKDVLAAGALMARDRIGRTFGLLGDEVVAQSDPERELNVLLRDAFADHGSPFGTNGHSLLAEIEIEHQKKRDGFELLADDGGTLGLREWWEGVTDKRERVR